MQRLASSRLEPTPETYLKAWIESGGNVAGAYPRAAPDGDGGTGWGGLRLFLHEGREVFVTFSARVTAWRAGEALDEAIERADGALFEAKRSGKNRTCTA